MKLENVREGLYFLLAQVLGFGFIIAFVYLVNLVWAPSAPVTPPPPTVAELTVKVEKLVADTQVLVAETKALLAETN
jgi:hypothetical protein